MVGTEIMRVYTVGVRVLLLLVVVVVVVVVVVGVV